MRSVAFLNFCPVPSAVAAERDAAAVRRTLLEDEIAALERGIARSNADCRPEVRAEVPPAEPEPEPEVQQATVPEPAPEPEPEPEPVQEELAACPQKRPVEVALLLDASTSMKIDFNVDRGLEEKLLAIERRIARSRNPIEQLILMPQHQALILKLTGSPGIDRIDVAKKALVKIVDHSPKAVNFSFFSFNQCGRPRSHGRFAFPKRGELIGRINGTELAGHTALADTLAQMPQYFSGGQSPDDPISLVLVSDGQDTCQGDPCAVATGLGRQFPYAHVNVIAIGWGLDELRCISKATNGLFLEPQNAEQLSSMLSRAANQDLPEHCQ